MVLVSIVGDFDSSVLPIFYEFKDDITKHILVYDDSSQESFKAKETKKALKTFKAKHNYKFKLSEYVIKEDSKESLLGLCSFLLLASKDPNDLFVNTTDGLSVVASMLNHKLMKKGVNFISYDMYDNKYHLFNKTTLQKFDIENNLNIKEHFLLKGYSYETSNIKKFANKHSRLISEVFEKHSKLYDAFVRLPPSKNSVKYLPKEFKKLKNLFVQMGFEETQIKHPTLTGVLFEAYAYNLIKHLDYDDIEVGLKVSKLYKNSYIENEFDILVMKNNHLHIIECKYRNKIQLEDLVYKYIALSEVVDRDGKMIIVTKKARGCKQSLENLQNGCKVQKRASMSNVFIMGAITQESKKFTLNVKGVFNL